MCIRLIYCILAQQHHVICMWLYRLIVHVSWCGAVCVSVVLPENAFQFVDVKRLHTSHLWFSIGFWCVCHFSSVVFGLFKWISIGNKVVAPLSTHYGAHYHYMFNVWSPSTHSFLVLALQMKHRIIIIKKTNRFHCMMWRWRWCSNSQHTPTPTHTHMFDYIDHILHNHISGRGSTYMLKVTLMS